MHARGVSLILMFGFAIQAEPASAVVVARSENPQDFGSYTINQNRFFHTGGWIADDGLEAADGNKFAGLHLDSTSSAYKSRNNVAGYIWYIQKDQYETSGANLVGGQGLGSPLMNGHVLRSSVWVATDARDPLVSDGTFSESFKLEISARSFDEGQSELIDTETDDPPGIAVHWAPANCNLTTNACNDSGTITSSGWTRLEVVYEIDDTAFTGTGMWSHATLKDAVEIRPVFSIADFTAAETERGTVYFDSPVVEVFPSMADLLNTPLDSVNPYPGGHVPVTATLGDFDQDGDVDGADYLQWQRGASPSPLSSADLSDWQANFGAPRDVDLIFVPEPESLLLVFAALVLFKARSTE